MEIPHIRFRATLVGAALLGLGLITQVLAGEPAPPPQTRDGYVAAIWQTFQALEAGNAVRARDWLETIASTSAENGRTFEWRYLWARCHSNAVAASTQKSVAGLVPSNTVSPLLFLADNRTLMAAGTNSILKLIDTSSLEAVDEINGAREPLHRCERSPLFFLVGYSGLMFWDPRAQVVSPIWYFLQGTDWPGAAFSDDGGLAAAQVGSGRVQIMDIAARQTLTNFVAHAAPISSLALSPDGQTLATAGAEGWLKLWDWKQTRCRETITNATAWTCLAFSRDGRQLAAAGADQTLLLCDLAGKTVAKRLIEHRQPALSLAFSPDNRTLASGTADGTIRLWHSGLGQELTVLRVHTAPSTPESEGAIGRLAFSPDGMALVARFQDGTLRVWRGANP